MLLWSDLASVALMAIGTAAVVGLPLAAIGAVVLELAGRRQPWVIALSVGLLGLLFGFTIVIADGDAPILVLSLAVAAILVGLLARGRQRGLAGLLLIATCLPWAMFAGAIVFDGSVADRLPGPGDVLAPFVASLAGIAVGLWLVRTRRVDGAGRPGGPPADAESGVGLAGTGPPARAWDAASRAAVGPTVFGLTFAAFMSVVGLLVGAQATAVVAHGRPLLEAVAVAVAGSVLTGLLATAVWVLAWPPRPRRAFEAFAWLGEADFERFRAMTGGAVAPTLDNMKRYVETVPERPDDRWIRVEVLAASGRVDAARAVAERLPDGPSVARAERAIYLGYLDWLAGGPGEVAELRAAIDAIEPVDGDDRLRGDVSIAIAEVRRRIAAGEPDAALPLRDVRKRLGRRADWILLRPARRLLPGYLRLAVVVVVAIILLDRAFTF